MSRYSLVFLAGLLTAVPAAASTWADKMFDEHSKDFGSVPRGPKLTHPFRLVNNTGYPVHISNVRASCGCVTAHVLHHDLAPGQETAVVVQMDTRMFQRDRNVTVFVQFDQPRIEEVRLWVQANSREDVSVSPDTLAFGRTKRGTSPTASVTVSFAGNGQWQVVGIASESNYVVTGMREVRRDGAEVAYELSARLRPDAPVGKWYTDIWLRTNNPTTPRIRVPLTVEIESALSVSPSTVVLGQVKSGTEAERKIIVRGVKPFRINQVLGTDPQWTVRDGTPDSKAVHVLTVTLKAKTPGDLNRTFRVISDLREEGDIEFHARAQVMP
jgi:hypothetical protein